LPRLIEAKGVTGTSVLFIGGSTSLILTVGSIAQLGSGWVLDRHGAKSLLITLFVGQTILLVFASMITGPLLIAVLTLFYALLYAWFPITVWLINKHVATNFRARLISYEYVASLGVTSLTIPFVAWMYEHGMTERSNLWIVVFAALVALITISLLPRDQISVATVAAPRTDRLDLSK